jgi:16S rRNA (cytidine1402-2'-O)-methyltransferase
MTPKKVEKISSTMRTPTLFLVPTPIGNLRDITLRALDVLKEVDLIACEDTRHTRKLLQAYGISKRLVSYEKFSEAKKVSGIVGHLEEGRSVALVSDAGTPLISDPGSVLIARVREKGFRIEGLPGPCAFVTALSASGFEGSFRFLGFFPRQAGEAERELTRMGLTPDITVFYESPHRIMTTLKLMDSRLGDRIICLAREISKVHEEYLTGAASEVMQELETRTAIGEVTVIVQGSSRDDAIDEEALKGRARALIASGRSKKDVLRALTEETGLGRNRIYEMLLNLD